MTFLRNGTRLKTSEKQKQSEEHRWLMLNSVKTFRKWGYQVKHRCFGVEGLFIASDYGMVKDNRFYFVECLTLGTPIPAIRKKLKLSQYAPVWFVISEGNKSTASFLGHHPLILKMPVTGHPFIDRRKFLEEFDTELKYNNHQFVRSVGR
ncbi:MAG: hypothetical protein V1894_05345 [Chloroflexota bacterium]